MLPVGICWSVTKKMGTTQMLGIVLGLTLVSGQLLNAYAVAGTAAADIPKWDFGFVQVDMIGYQAQVIPAILAAFTLVYLEKFFRKICPSVISMIVVPFCSLVLSVMAAHFVLGPIGWKIGSVISSVVYAGITGPLRIVFGAIFGFVYAPLVITGLHHMSNAIDLQLIADFGGTMLWPMIALSNIAQGSAVLGMIYLQKGSKHSVMYLLLSGGYRTGNVWCKLETQLSFHLRYDWFCMCINCLCSYKQYSKCNRCWRSSGNPFHAAAIHVNLCYLYVNCRSSSICINSYGW